MEVRRVNCFSTTVSDRPGRLASFVGEFSKRGVDLGGLWTFSVGEGKAWIITVPKDVASFKKVASEIGVEAAEGTCFHISGDDSVGTLHKILSAVAERELNIHALDAVSVDGKFGCYIWSETTEVEQLADVLGV